MDRKEITEALGYYVYALVNPITDQIFYIGKGKGDRVFAHAKGVKSLQNDKEDSEKIALIKDILIDMKKFILFISLFLLSIMQMMAQGTSLKGTITLSHQGKETNFDYNKMTDAVEAAVDGDTIYLSAGYFEGDFILNKKLAFIGSGADSDNGVGTYTCYSGRIILKMAENTKLTARLFEGIWFWNASFSYQTAIENVVFKKCRGIDYNFSVDAEIKSMLFDRCRIDGCGCYTDNNIKKIVSRNCSIDNFSNDSWYSSTDDIPIRQFIHCTIDPSNYVYSDDEGNYHYYCPIIIGEYVNCIIDNDDNGDNTGFCLYDRNNTDRISKVSFTNCLFYKPKEGVDIFNGATVKDNIYYEAPTDNNTAWTRLEVMTMEQLQANNFLGNDGTVVGCLGGKNPYSLKMASSVIISSSKVHFDANKKQVQIRMKVSSQK